MNFRLDMVKANTRWVMPSQYNDDVVWFNKYFEEIIWEEGWYIRVSYDGVINIYLSILNKITLEQAVIYARDYGWIVKDNIIIGFDINNLKRNKHLISSTDLGLL